jgi:hypothetical protein
VVLTVYDFGDGWEHEIRVENVAPCEDETIVCVAGAQACPPEDCGGAVGYAHLLEVLGNPGHEEHHQLKPWAGHAFDPEKFDRSAANKKLGALSK